MLSHCLSQSHRKVFPCLSQLLNRGEFWSLSGDPCSYSEGMRTHTLRKRWSDRGKEEKWALAVFTDILGITRWKMSRCIDRHAHTQEQHADQVTGKLNVKHFPQLINHRRSCRYKHTIPQHLGSHSEQRHRRACSNMVETCIMSDPNTHEQL